MYKHFFFIDWHLPMAKWRRCPKHCRRVISFSWKASTLLEALSVVTQTRWSSSSPHDSRASVKPLAMFSPVWSSGKKNSSVNTDCGGSNRGRCSVPSGTCMDGQIGSTTYLLLQHKTCRCAACAAPPRLCLCTHHINETRPYSCIFGWVFRIWDRTSSSSHETPVSRACRLERCLNRSDEQCQ